MNAEISINLNKETMGMLKNLPDSVIKQVARMTLDLSYNIIPLSHNKNNGELRRSSMAYGVQGGNGDYTIGSITSYALYVWNKDANRTNWSTPGTTSKWYETTFKRKGKIIVATAIMTNYLK